MADEDSCISRFFKGDVGEIDRISPDRFMISALKTLDYSQDISQTSIDSQSDLLSMTQLTIDEPEPLNIRPFYNITIREMPTSPHYVIEEEFSQNPWALLIATIFLTKTPARNARRYIKSFFEEYQTPYDVLSDSPTSLERFFESLGLRKRGHMIWKLSYQFVSSKWRRASDLCGIGKYGEDAYRIFCLGHIDVDPGDRYLKLYLDWLRTHTEFFEDNGIVPYCECVIEDPILKYYRITLRDGD
ncbi:unnamed protein product [Parnassius mnemosyne]|uniref:Methyl-CpG-binding domain protein 4 n=1 Tax=Parnassius mnemosyne TaxID=213953 RepID=A0AAV1L4Y8_9NEOP